MKSLGGPAEVQLLGDGDEATELIELEQRSNSGINRLDEHRSWVYEAGNSR
jgi:hypothetical protein